MRKDASDVGQTRSIADALVVEDKMQYDVRMFYEQVVLPLVVVVTEEGLLTVGGTCVELVQDGSTQYQLYYYLVQPERPEGVQRPGLP